MESVRLIVADSSPIVYKAILKALAPAGYKKIDFARTTLDVAKIIETRANAGEPHSVLFLGQLTFGDNRDLLSQDDHYAAQRDLVDQARNLLGPGAGHLAVIGFNAVDDMTAEVIGIPDNDPQMVFIPLGKDMNRFVTLGQVVSACVNNAD